MTDMTILNEIFKLERFNPKVDLSIMNKLMDCLGNPQNKFESIHIAGTNGKGSTATFISSALIESGKKVGLFTSPHIHKYNERFKINNEDISDEDLINTINHVKKVCDKNKIDLTFFEFTTAVCFDYYSKKNIDIAVVEVGLGGRLDATNVIKPKVSIITSIGLDHTQYLGETTLDISKEKAGIIKNNTNVITAEKNNKIVEQFKSICENKKSKLINIKNYEIIEHNLDGQTFRYDDVKYDINLLGKHQIDNACCAIEALKQLNIDEEHIKSGLSKNKWNGRLEIISKNPLIIVDGAHNPDGMNKLVEFIEELDKKVVLVIALSRDKNVNDMTCNIKKYCKHIIITKGSFKPMEPQKILEEINFKSVESINDPNKAVKAAKNMLKENEILLITGSIYMIGKAIIDQVR